MIAHRLVVEPAAGQVEARRQGDVPAGGDGARGASCGNASPDCRPGSCVTPMGSTADAFHSYGGEPCAGGQTCMEFSRHAIIAGVEYGYCK